MSRLRFLINPIGSHGDVDPILAIGKELLSRGHRVFVLTNAVYRDVVQSLGMRFVRVGKKQDMSAIGNSPGIRQIGQAWKHALHWAAIGTMRETYEAINRYHLKSRTVIVSAVTSFGSRIAAEKLGIPLATVLIDPDKLRGTDHAPVTPPLVLSTWVPRSIKQLQYWIADRFVIDPIVVPDLNKFRNELELPPIHRPLMRWWFSNDLVIGLFDEWFAPRSNDWPPNVHCVGPAIWNPPCEETTGLEMMDFVRSGSPPIVFIAGSAGPTNNRFFDVAMESTVRLKSRAIFLHNNPNIVPKQLPDTIRHYKYYSPLHSLLSHCSALVHHAGTGTAFHAIKAGIPQLVAPQTFDQPDIAMRLKRLGIARVMKPANFTTATVTSNLKMLLDDPELQSRCRDLSAKLANRKSAASACDLIEQLAPQQRGNQA